MRRGGAREQCGIARYVGRICVYSMMQMCSTGILSVEIKHKLRKINNVE